MRYEWLLGLALAGPLAAQDVRVGECRPAGGFALDQPTFDVIECDLTNEGQIPIARVSYTASFTEEGRTVPWAVMDGQLMPISGGIEPGETASVALRGEYLSGRADPSRIIIGITITGAFDVNGEPIPAD